MKFYSLILIAILLSGCLIKTAEETDNKSWKYAKQLDAYLNAHVANHRFSGSLIIASGDSIIHQYHEGWANREFMISNSDSTRYLIGSITKPIVAACILKLVEAEELQLEDKLSVFFPEFPRADEVTVEQLLTHTSGIRDYHYFPNWKKLSQTDITPKDVIAQVATDPFRFDPGTSFRYSNTGYVLLGLIIEQVSNETFTDFVQEQILDPLNMVESGVINNESRPDQLALGYTTNPRESRLADYINYNQPYTSGNMYSTPADLSKFTKAIVDTSLFTKELTVRIFESGMGNYGLGWGIRNFKCGVSGVGHYGGMNGFWGSLTYLPDSDITICFLGNDDNIPKITITEDLVALINNQPYALPDRQTFTPYSETASNLHEGDYLIKPGDTLHVYSSENHLYMKETGQSEYELFRVAPNTYAMTMQEFTVHIEEDTLQFRGLVNLTAPRVKRD